MTGDLASVQDEDILQELWAELRCMWMRSTLLPNAAAGPLMAPVMTELEANGFVLPLSLRRLLRLYTILSMPGGHLPGIKSSELFPWMMGRKADFPF